MTEIHFDGRVITNGDAPFNEKLGKAGTLAEAIDRARQAHQQANGAPQRVDNEDVVIVDNGDSLWEIWEKEAKPHGVSWEEFLQSNQHLKQPRNLGGTEQPGWKDYWLVHKGDVVFIPDGPTGGGPATVSSGGNTGALVKKDGKWKFEVKDGGKTLFFDLAPGQILTVDGVKYRVETIEGDNAKVQRLKPDNTPDGAPLTFDLNKYD